MDFFVFVIVFAAVLGFNYVMGMTGEAAITDALRRDRLEPVTVERKFWKGGRHSLYIAFSARTAKGVLVTGHAIKYGAKITMNYDGDHDRLSHLRELAADDDAVVQPAAEMDLETRIRFETNQRLERLQGDRAAFLENDLNGDGAVDAEEWELTRVRIEAEVRTELASGVSTQPSNAPTVEPEPQAEAVEAEADGHW